MEYLEELYTFYLISQNEIVLVDLLESKPPAGLPVLHQVHRPVGAVGHQLDHLEVLFTRRLGLELDLKPTGPLQPMRCQYCH